MMSTSNVTRTLPRVDQTAIDALAARLAATTLPRLTTGSSAAPGPTVDTAERLLAHWIDHFDFRALEDRVEALGHVVTTTADGRRLAAIHAVPEVSTGVPILLVHGWPDSPLRFLELIPLLTAAGHEVVAPAIPGFWLSDEPAGEMSRELAAEDFHALMTELGHERYAVHGGDWGSAVAQTIAQTHSEAVVALHLTDVPFDLAFTIDRESATEPEVAYLDAIETFSTEAFYLTGNTTRPNLVATALQDSPVGLVSWLGALYDDWSTDGVADEHVVANAATLLLTSTVRSSMRLYTEPAASWDTESWGDDAGAWGETTDGGEWGDASTEGGAEDWSGDWAPAKVAVPTAFAIFPADLSVAPRELADRHFAVERFTVMPRGGHFAALEEPQLLADDLLAFVADRS